MKLVHLLPLVFSDITCPTTAIWVLNFRVVVDNWKSFTGSIEYFLKEEYWMKNMVVGVKMMIEDLN